ncbi:MAG: 4Fe-4S dicluster domain-containing protein [Polyangiaceae bacterium]|nr:4Fe-4S dicluster domain-containing protein [Polyangiaceae bacterium]
MPDRSTDESQARARDGATAPQTPGSPDGPTVSGTRASVTLRVRRQEGQNPRVEWDSFGILRRPGMTVLDALWAVRRDPATTDGRSKPPPAFECGCSSGACGACTMVINNRVRLACRTLVDDVSPKGGPITLAPLAKFPLVRDLVVDRAHAERALCEVRGWVELGDEPPKPAPEAPARQRQLEALGRCIGCAACMEVCPQYGEHSDFLGPAALAQVTRLNETAVGQWQKTDRLALVMAPGGIADCGKAQNCVEVCPVGVPVVDGLQRLAGATTREMLLGWLLGR